MLKHPRRPLHVGLYCATLALPTGCSSSAQKPPPTLSTTRSSVPEEAIGQQFGTMSLTVVATSSDYGYSQKTPVQVGGGFGDGGHNTYRYLNALLGPQGQPVHYTRIGTCCPFKTPNSPFEGEGILEVYEITYEGGKPARLYFDWYDSGDLSIPVGLTARK